MAKVQASVAGQKYMLFANEEESAMRRVIAEANRRVEGARLQAKGEGPTERLVLALLDAVAELMQVQSGTGLSEREVHALQARLTYLESCFQYAQAIEESKALAKSPAARPNNSKKKRSKLRDFHARQVEIQA